MAIGRAQDTRMQLPKLPIRPGDLRNKMRSRAAIKRKPNTRLPKSLVEEFRDVEPALHESERKFAAIDILRWAPRLSKILELREVDMYNGLNCSPSGSMRLCAPLCIGLIAAIIFANTIMDSFVWDDRAAVLTNADVHGTTPLLSLMQHDFWGQNILLPQSHKSFRPLTVLSFRINYYFGALHAGGYHLVNLTVHGITSGLIVVLGRRVIDKEFAAIFAGLLFAVHPVHCDAVASIVGRADVLAGMFYVLGLLTYFKMIEHEGYRRLLYHVFALLLGLFAMLSKETGFTLFGLYVGLDLLVALQKSVLSASDIRDLKASLGRHRATLRATARQVVFTVLFAMSLLAWRVSLNGPHRFYKWTIMENHLYLLPDGPIKILSYMHAHAKYLSLLLYPRHLSYDWGFYSIPLIKSPTDPRLLSIAVSYSLLLLTLYKCMVRKNFVLMAMLFIGIFPFIPASHLLMPVGAVVAERLLYIPSIGFCLIVGYCVDLFIRTIIHLPADVEVSATPPIRSPSQNSPVSRFMGLRFILCVLGAVLLLGVWRTIERNEDWNSERGLFSSALKAAPQSLKVLNNLGQELLGDSDSQPAIEVLERSTRIFPKYKDGYINLGLAYSNLNQSRKAIEAFLSSTHLNLHVAMGHGYLGRELLNLWTNNGGDVGKGNSELLDWAEKELEISVQLKPRLPVLYFYRGVIHYHKKEYSDASRLMDRAIELNNDLHPIETKAKVAVSRIANMKCLSILDQGHYEEALDCFGQAMKYEEDSDTFYLYNNAAMAHSKVKRLDKAVELYEKALKTRPDPIVMSNLGFTYEEMGMLDEAMHWYSRAYELSPGHHQVRSNYINLQTKLLSRATPAKAEDIVSPASYLEENGTALPEPQPLNMLAPTY